MRPPKAQIKRRSEIVVPPDATFEIIPLVACVGLLIRCNHVVCTYGCARDPKLAASDLRPEMLFPKPPCAASPTRFSISLGHRDSRRYRPLRRAPTPMH